MKPRIESNTFKRIPKRSPLSLAISISILSLAHSAAHAATITVTSPLDDNGENCTLREAIQSANTAISQNNGCALGSSTGTDTITFSNSLPGNTVTLINSALNVGAGKDIEIDASNVTGGITLNGNQESTLISIREASVTFNSTTFTGGFSKDEFSEGYISVYGDPLIGVNDGTLALINSSVTNNLSSAYAGLINSNNADIEIRNSSINNNSSRGALLKGSSGDTANLDNVIVNANQSIGDTIQLFRFESVSINNSSISSNNVTGRFGGVLNWDFGGSASLTNSTISNNRLVSESSVKIGAPIVIVNATISGNSLSSPPSNTVFKTGGGIETFDSDLVRIINTTITDNTAPNIGLNEVNAVGRTTLSLVNSIVANSVAGADCALSTVTTTPSFIISDGNSIIEDDGNCVTQARNIDPQLGPLADNGGPTLTHSLPRGSPAINSGDNATCAASDQRGKTRALSLNDPCDVGSFELLKEDLVQESATFVIPLSNGKTVIFDL